MACWLALAAYLAAYVAQVLSFESSRDMEFTFLLPAGSKECFFQPVAKDNMLEFEYQVIGEPNMDVIFTMLSPSGRRLFEDNRKSRGLHKLQNTDEGDYQLCFDNVFSKMKEKLLFFTLVISDPNDMDEDDEELLKEISDTETMEYRLQDFKARIDALHQKIQRGRVIQLMLRTFDTKDQRLQDNNLWRVSFWSFFCVVVIMVVGVSQVRVLESLFPGS
ncbi:transmembrane emp24 domain-containing protein 5-like [Syngnathus typhle]|uniref:transmembrane emp24 domain-containing protein 5-like n=1 Tax=Syngnathus typhle TaxID=161592 RepID=UPI002A6B4CE0|nr:transmembrane emp24 domain-containing protein 5-like [Syngnathus typhle]